MNPQGKFTQYDKVTIVVVGFFGSDPGKVSPKDEQRLTDLFYKNLQEALAKRYQVVDEAGPGVMKVEVALLDAEAATPGVRSITMVVPQLRLLSAGYAVVAGTYPFSGGGQAAAKVTDSMTEESLAWGWTAGPAVEASRRRPSGNGAMPRTRSSSGPRNSPTACTHTLRARRSHRDVRDLASPCPWGDTCSPRWDCSRFPVTHSSSSAWVTCCSARRRGRKKLGPLVGQADPKLRPSRKMSASAAPAKTPPAATSVDARDRAKRCSISTRAGNAGVRRPGR